MQLNDAQNRAVMHREGPMLVLAGPGSGKTRVITERVKKLIRSGVKPERILVITFTKAAANEMKSRYQNEERDVGRAPGMVRYGTFHSVFFSILKVHYRYNASNILREEDHYRILKDIVAAMDLEEVRDENEFIKDVMAEISLVKGGMMDVNNYYSPSCSGDIFKNIYNKYNDILIKKRLLDFDDMLIYTYELLKEREDIRKLWQSQFDYILVDEFQDVNFLQYEITKLLIDKRHNIFVVGDDDQSIYGFRGANPGIMRKFLKDFSESEKVVLNVNYRSTYNIVTASSKVIGNNTSRMNKKLTAFNEKDNSPVDIREFKDLNEENSAVIEVIRENASAGKKYSDISVLFRTNLQGRSLVSALTSANIPFFMKDTVPNIYEHWISKDILSYIKISLGRRDRAYFLRVINRPNRYISRSVFTEATVDLQRLEALYSDKDWMVERIVEFEEDLEVISKMRPYAGINYIRRKIGYDEYIRDYADDRRLKPDDFMGIMDELMSEAKKFKDYEAWFEYIDEYTKMLNEKKNEKRMQEKKDDAVVLQTMHSSKGLEYDTVIIPDANESVTPHNKAVLKQDLEEERRMFYVAMTRAKKDLHIFCVKERFGKDVIMSRFVQEVMR